MRFLLMIFITLVSSAAFAQYDEQFSIVIGYQIVTVSQTNDGFDKIELNSNCWNTIANGTGFETQKISVGESFRLYASCAARYSDCFFEGIDFFGLFADTNCIIRQIPNATQQLYAITIKKINEHVIEVIFLTRLIRDFQELYD